MLTRVLAASAAVAFVVAFAAPAEADADADAKFIHGLDIGQIPYEDPDFAVLLGHLVCLRLSGATGTYPATSDYVRGAHPA